MNNQPVISVVIPAHNEEDYLPFCLEAVKRAAVALPDVGGQALHGGCVFSSA